MDGERARSFAEVWPRSSYIYIFAAAKGRFPGGLTLTYERDSVIVTVKYKLGGEWEQIEGILEAATKQGEEYADNSDELLREPGKWRIPTDAEKIRVVVTYIMEGPRSVLTRCFSEVSYWTGHVDVVCGETFGERKVRLGFYLELILIPDQYLTPG